MLWGVLHLLHRPFWLLCGLMTMNLKNYAHQAVPLLRHCSVRGGELGAKSKQQGKQGQCPHQHRPSPTVPKQSKQSRSSDGNQLQPKVRVTRQVPNNEVGLS